VSLKITIMIHSAGTAVAEGGIAVRVFSLHLNAPAAHGDGADCPRDGIDRMNRIEP
jgi:hypothetical protein